MAKHRPSKSKTLIGANNQQETNERSAPAKIKNHGKPESHSSTASQQSNSDKAIRYYLPSRRDRIIAWAVRWVPVITYFNVFLVIFSYLLVKVSYKQADIADRQTRDNEMTQRAFVFVRGPFALDYNSNQAGQLIDYTVEPNWENSGITPASDVRLNTTLLSRVGLLPDDFSFPDSSLISAPSTFPPKSTTVGAGKPVPHNDLLAFLQGAQTIYFFGWGKYRDVFKNAHLTEFCAQAIRYSGEFDNPAKPLMLNWRQCNHHNCSDEDCSDYESEMSNYK